MKYGIIGEHLGHSYSKQIHECIFGYTYELCPLPPKELGGFIRGADYEGLNITIPYKKAVIEYLDEISEEASRIGSVNTVVRRNGRLCGYNTDYYGFMRMAKRAQTEFSGRKVIILGTGGTSVTAQSVAADMGAAEIAVVSRSGHINYENVYRHSDAEIIINTTPVGMYPDNDGQIINPARFPELRGVLDVVYNPVRTNLVLDARETGIKAAGGLTMLVCQAIASAELFTQTKTNDRLTEFFIGEMHRKFQNIVLIGMPGCGKTTVGRELALQMNREFVDTDDLVVKKEGLSVPDIFARRGDKEFRKSERACTAEAAKSGGAVIATGGGCVLDPDNIKALRRNGRIYYLDRDITALASEGRPLSGGKYALEKLYNERRPLYMNYGDVRICGNKTAECAAKDILEDFCENIGD